MKNRLTTILFGGPGASTQFGDVGLLILRAGIGLMLAVGHGYGKVFENGFGPDARFIEGVGRLGFPAPTLFAWCAALAEYLGGLLIAVGLLTRPAGLIIAINMFVAAFLQHANNDFFGQPPNKEYAMLFFVPAVALMFTGAGRFSIDGLIRR